MYGGHIFGAGRGATILDASDNGNVIRTNGMSYSHIETMELRSRAPGGGSGGAGIRLDLNWDNTNPAGTVGLQNNTFTDMLMTCGGTGVRIANNGYGGSGNIFMACFISEAKTGTGITTLGAQAIGNSIIGGNVSACHVGLSAVQGGFSVIQGWSIQNFHTAAAIDISLGVNSVGPTVISGCRTETAHFLVAAGAGPVTVSGCASRGTDNGPLEFAEIHCPAIIESCSVVAGKILAREGARLKVQNCWFERGSDWLDAPAASLWYTPANPYSANIEIENVVEGNPIASNILKQRKFTTNGTTLTTQNYTVA